MTTYVRAQPASEEFKAWFDAELAKILPLAETMIRDDQHVPMIRAYMTNGKISMFVIPHMGEPGAKDVVAQLHQLAAQSENVTASMFICEAWAVWDGLPSTRPAESLANHPNRIDALAINCIMRNMQLMATVEITGTLEAKDRKFGELRIADVNDPQWLADGRFVASQPSKLDS